MNHGQVTIWNKSLISTSDHQTCNLSNSIAITMTIIPLVPTILRPTSPQNRDSRAASRRRLRKRRKLSNLLQQSMCSPRWTAIWLRRVTSGGSARPPCATGGYSWIEIDVSPSLLGNSCAEINKTRVLLAFLASFRFLPSLRTHNVRKISWKRAG